jgi:hypothetical protein
VGGNSGDVRYEYDEPSGVLIIIAVFMWTSLTRRDASQVSGLSGCSRGLVVVENFYYNACC